MQADTRPQDEPAEFVASFVDDSMRYREPFEEIWDETERSYLVRGAWEESSARSTRYPLVSSGDPRLSGVTPGGQLGSDVSMLVDPETHQEVMTIASKLVLALMGEPGFLRARRVGAEDTRKGDVATRLVTYCLGLPDNFMSFFEWIVQMCVNGTGIMEGYWDYREGPRTFRSLAYDPYTGETRSSSTVMTAPVFDDLRFCPLPIRDFFPDPAATRLSLMSGAAKRFRITSAIAKGRVAAGMYDNAAVGRAIERRTSDMSQSRTAARTGDATLGSDEKQSHPDFMDMIGYEYIGRYPVPTADGIDWRVLTNLNGETVRNEPWARPLPFFSASIIPRLFSFYGVAPAEIIRFDQDFANTLKMMLADAVVRSVHMSPVVDQQAMVNQNLLRRMHPGKPIVVRGSTKDAVSFLQYNPDLRSASGLYANQKQQMREATGALGSVQGLGLGVDRASATEADQTYKNALDRPEMFATVLERTALPPIGLYTIASYKEYLEDDAALARRIGESEATVALADIQEEFDLEFIGSRIEGSRAQQLANYREIFALGQNPVAAPLIPWLPLLHKFIGDRLGAYDIAQMIGDPKATQVYMLLQKLGGPNSAAGNGNGEAGALPPPGMGEAQTGGEMVA